MNCVLFIDVLIHVYELIYDCHLLTDVLIHVYELIYALPFAH